MKKEYRSILRSLKCFIREFLNYLFSRNYYTHRLWLKYRLKIDTRHTPIFLVYSSGKTGTTTLTVSLKTQMNLPVYHIHRLTSNTVKENLNYFKKNHYKTKFLPDNIIYSFNILKIINKGFDLKKFKIISAVRDPMQGILSEKFENMFSQKERINDYKEKELTEKLTKEIQEWLDNTKKIENWMMWFDQELKLSFGFDVYSREFDKEKGYQIYKNDGYPVILILKLEKIKDALAGLEEFTGIKDFHLTEANVASKKNYYFLYKSVCKGILLPEETINKTYSSKYMTNFYTEKEIEELREKWSKKKYKF